jgi:hypothetical protein
VCIALSRNPAELLNKALNDVVNLLLPPLLWNVLQERTRKGEIIHLV